MYVFITTPTAKGKKYRALIYETKGDNRHLRTVNFGAAGYEDYTIHKDPARKERYIQRHSKEKGVQAFMGQIPINPEMYFTASFWSVFLLWNKPTLSASVKDTISRNKKFSLEIKLDREMT